MIELLVIFVLATIGIYFTTMTPESMDRSRGDDDYAEDGAQDDDGGIGILGVDVGRNVKTVRRAGAAARDRIALLQRRPIKAKRQAEEAAVSPVAAPEPLAAEASVDDAVRSLLIEDGAELSAAPEPAEAEENLFVPDSAAEDLPPLKPAEPEPEAAPVVAEAPAPAEEPRRQAARDAALSAAIRAEMAEHERNRTAPPELYQGPPVIEDFDPDEDQIVIGYYRGEAGDGRIAITEDPTSPGTARVTLGGKVVALVPFGYGLVQRHHVEMRLLEDTAAA
ncbi:hypothetical protein [Pseudooceanicola sp. LIPI14-2-Ac024]|uniref:hypothetical protein n=1 Tax=Pseudooceanicola sp. LIPI14-2-Ac024 TaxID=3344875 RepID=UPI0035CEE378